MCARADSVAWQSIDKLRLPVSTRGGYLKQLSVEVPWTSLSSTVRPRTAACSAALWLMKLMFSLVQPVKVNIDTVVLLLCPNNAWAEPSGLDGSDHYKVLVGILPLMSWLSLLFR